MVKVSDVSSAFPRDPAAARANRHSNKVPSDELNSGQILSLFKKGESQRQG